MDIRVVETYLIWRYLGPAKKTSPTIGGHFLDGAFKMLLIPTAAFFIIGYILVLRDQMIDITHYLLITLLPIPLTAIFSIWRMKRFMESFTYESLLAQIRADHVVEPKKWEKNLGYYYFIGLVIISFIRRQSPSIGLVIFVAIVPLLIVLFVDLSTSLLYLFYLLKKYCPYLKTPADARYYEPPEQENPVTPSE